MQKWLRRLTRIELVLIFLVIIAGSVVRMTGSGMGCPDWPKCFGYLIPPTERAQLEWSPGRQFEKGNIIIVNEALFQAKTDFVSSQSFAANNWEKYTKHDYALFNPTHTWIEYINRLLGALSGLPMVLILALSLFYLRQDLRLPLLAAAGVFMLGFEAWLGKLVVDGNLIPGSITIHMLGALIILSILLLLNGILSHKQQDKSYFTPAFKYGLILSLVFTLVQIILGTQVRETVDTLQQSGMPRPLWINNMDLTFYIHRSFSLLILAINLWLWYTNRKLRLGYWQMNPIVLVLALEILLGVILAYFDFPYFAQPLHLLLGALLFAFQFHALVVFALNKRSRIIAVK